MIGIPFMSRCCFTILCCLGFLGVKAREFQPYRYIPARYDLEAIPFNTKKDVGFLVDMIEDNEGFLWVSGNKSIYAYDGNKMAQYAGNRGEFPLRKGNDGSYGIIYKDTSGLFYIQERSYYSFICFDPFRRKPQYEFNVGTAQNKGLRFMMSISDKNDMVGVFQDQKQKKYIIKPVIAGKETKELFSDHYNQYEEMAIRFGSGYHWLFHKKQIVRVTPDGSQAKVYHLPGEQTIFAIYSDQKQIFFLNRDCTYIYTWDKETDKIIPYLALPNFPIMPLRGSPYPVNGLTRFAIHEEMIYLGNQFCFYVIDTKARTIQDLSETYNKQPVSKTGNELVKILPAGNGSVFLLKANNVLQLTKKESTGNPFLVSFQSDEKGDTTLYSYRAITEDDQGGIYASYYNGVMYKKKGQQDFEVAAFTKKIQPKIVSLYDMNYWKGYLLWNNLLYPIKSGQYRFLDDGHKMRHTTQCLDKDTLWYYVWESGILHRYDLNRHKQTVYDIDKEVGAFGEAIEELSDMIPDHTGRNLWLATKWDGIVLITKEGKLVKKFGWKQLKIKDGLGATVNKLHLSGDSLWYGCADGLGLLNTRTGANELFNNPYNEDGLLHNREVYSLLVDDLDNFFLGTSKGIVYFNKKDRKFYNLPEGHALASLEFNRTSAFKASDKQYYFGSTSGLYSFAAKDLPFNIGSADTLKPIKMFSISVFNRRLKKYKYFGVWPESGKDLVLAPNENTISINFSVPEFEKTVYYSYRILEQDEEWKEYSLDNRIYLYSLRSGTYTLEIKASADLSDDTARFFKINIIVQQEWHKLVWVRLLMLCCIVTIVVLIMRWRYREKLRKQQELSDLRLKISMDLHDDVGSILSGLAVQSEMLSYTSTGNSKKSLNNISSMSRMAMETMRDII